MQTYAQLEEHGASAAQRIVQAHLAELRVSLGPEVFDEALAEAMRTASEGATEE